MTLTVAWVRRIKRSYELVIISDSRLRSYGAIDQAQKIMPLQRGDAALAFCGDSEVCYPFFVQASSAMNNFIRTRTRGSDVTETSTLLVNILNNLVDSWDAPLRYKRESLAMTRLLFAGWSWRRQRFSVGFFRFVDKKFVFQNSTNPVMRPWREKKPSLVVIGDYIEEYMRILGKILSQTNPVTNRWTLKTIDLQYEPLEALSELLKLANENSILPKIGGKPQMLKIYPYSSILPIVIRSDDNKHYLFGRRLFEWEKTEYPIAAISPGRTEFIYPMSSIPVPSDLGLRVNPIRQFIQFITSRGED